jgi:16S rRNA (guanine527-N7)-methyltransferase
MLSDLTDTQRRQLAEYERQLAAFNRKLNLVSGRAVAEIRERHVLHSLALAVRDFPAGAGVVDWGTGGGLPAIPLAIRFPDVVFHPVDSVGKKIMAVETMVRRIGLANVRPWNGRAEEWPGRAHYAMSRATAPLADLWRWFERVRQPLADVPDGAWSPGLVCLKGGDLSDELAALDAEFPGLSVETIPLPDVLDREFARDKVILHVTAPPPAAA